ncbi:hybrid sensor histidine kinase/response regulator [Marichromatium bheemlicum]|uniref:histidine kinase n=1 Tax=Marichromatium bheemlicum TaxID=365339 RepID=A0ABX1I3F6_9GAMM|nr:PAS domain-containing protein [Marichromatium bheemlicum]NKN32038.1 PAS domain-containing protein [Marichromatium bheemlicum]
MSAVCMRYDPFGAELLGLAAGECEEPRARFLERIHPGDRSLLLNAIASRTAQRPAYRVRYRVDRSEAEAQVFEEHAVVRFTAAGVPHVLQGVITDISRERAHDQALLDQLTEFEAIYDCAPVGLCVLDQGLRFRRINRRMAEMNGVPVAAHIGRSLPEVLPALAPQLVALARHVLAGGGAVRDHELHGETPATPGVRRHWRTSWLPLNTARGEVWGVSVVVHEITAQRRTERRLADSESRFRSMAETVPDILFIAAPDGAVVDFNQRFTEVTGIAYAQALGEGWRAAVYPDDREVVARTWARALREHREFLLRYRLCCATGGYRWFEARARPICGSSGELLHWFGSVSEIDELVRARERLEQLDRQKNDFLAVLGHELRNPMAPVRNAIELMQALAPAEPRLREAITVVDRQARHMERLLDDLLDVSRVIRGKLHLERAVHPVGEVVEHALDGARALFESRQQRFTLELSDSVAYIDCDLSRLAQVLVNLLTNAAKYTPEGGEIRLSVEPAPDVVALRVTDNGEGFAPELSDGLFEPFIQGGRGHERPASGLGLGLAIAARLAELHQGRIEAHSAGRGCGAEFVLWLPRVWPAHASPPAPAAPARLRGVPVLVVDDDVDMLSSMARLLEWMGHPVQVAHSGHEALAVVAGFTPRLALLDIGMEGMDGLETARALRAYQPDPERLLLVAVSGYGAETLGEALAASGFDLHLTKPVGRARLEALLQRVVAQSPDSGPGLA